MHRSTEDKLLPANVATDKIDPQSALPLLRCERLVVGYGGRGILPPIDFALCTGELCAVVGRNGAGKTTWVRTLVGLLAPVAGRIVAGAHPLPLGYVAQRQHLEAIVPLQVRDVVAMGLDRGSSILSPFLPFRKRLKLASVLAEMELSALAHEAFGNLSEGQKQRVLIARLLIGEPRLVLLDEPTAAMDQVAERETLRLIKQMTRTHSLSALIVSHQVTEITRLANRVVFVDRATRTFVHGTPGAVCQNVEFCKHYGEQGLD
jgi:zinc transport system ATP-binding protein